jgi:transcriptional regulator with XRE-family HTH domain
VNAGNEAYQGASAEFRQRLIKARRAAGLKQKDVSIAMGKPKSFISKCEQGERRLDFVEVLMLAKIYRKDVSFFIVI